MRRYRFDIKTPYKRDYIGIIIATDCEDNARRDAHTLMEKAYGRNYRITTERGTAKIMRRMPNNEPVKDAYTTEESGERVYWAWWIV